MRQLTSARRNGITGFLLECFREVSVEAGEPEIAAAVAEGGVKDRKQKSAGPAVASRTISRGTCASVAGDRL